MKILKFGGTSLANAESMLNVLSIIDNQIQTAQIGVVVSAVSGVTRQLFNSVEKAITGADISELVLSFRSIHEAIISALISQNKISEKNGMLQYIDEMCHEYRSLLQGIYLIQVCPDPIFAKILSLGECLSVHILYEICTHHGIRVQLLDACEYIKTKGGFREGVPLLDQIECHFARLKSESCAQVWLMAGFIGSDGDGKLTLLGFNGSDYSAALMARGLQAESCEIWTDVEGVYSADPRWVPDAKLIPEMSYEEAMELSFYGATVLHPKTIHPLFEYSIPIFIRNTCNPQALGTQIHAKVKQNQHPVRGISSLNQIAVINVSGAGMRGVPGIAARIFSAISKQDISIILITQSSSEYSICFCVKEVDALKAVYTLEEEFLLERRAHLIDPIDVLLHHSILCIVGDQMKHRKGLAGKFFTALSASHTNVIAISQGSSERSISAVIDGKDYLPALRMAHQFFFNTLYRIDLFLLGVGTVGSQLLEVVKIRQKELLAQNIHVRVLGIANSKQVLISKTGIHLENWEKHLGAASKKENDTVSLFSSVITSECLLNPVLVDCTTSEKVAQCYSDYFSTSMHIVTANKKANTSSYDYYKQLRKVAKTHCRHFLYETNVGAGLPVIDTLQNLLESGDQLLKFSGILSGSLSYLFGLLEEGAPFSQAVRLAVDQKFTEPDPRDDLSGMDVARKLLILHREIGGQLNLNDIEMIPLFPTSFSMNQAEALPDFLKRLETLDDYFARQVMEAKKNHQVLRYIGEFEKDHCRVGLMSIDKNDPLASVKGGENAFVFLTQRYSPIPLVIRGYGAGPSVTAAGVFANILQIAKAGLFS